MSGFAKATEIAKREVREIIPVAIFFLVGFNLINFSKHLILAEVGINYEGVVSASIGAILVAKVVLLTQLLPFMDILLDRPLYQHILYKSGLYTIFVAILRLAEIVVDGWIHSGNLGGAIATAVNGFVLAHFVFVLTWVFVLFLFYVTLSQLRDEFLGGVPFVKILFSRERKRLYIMSDVTVPK